MSATLDPQLFLNYFGGVPLHIPGRQHHVTVLYAREPQPDWPLTRRRPAA